MYCTVCGTKLLQNELECINCGHINKNLRLNNKIGRKCPNCDKYTEDPIQYCSFCGKLFVDTQQYIDRYKRFMKNNKSNSSVDKRV